MHKFAGDNWSVSTISFSPWFKVSSVEFKDLRIDTRSKSSSKVDRRRLIPNSEYKDFYINAAKYLII